MTAELLESPYQYGEPSIHIWCNSHCMKQHSRPEPILLFFHLFFFPEILYFLPILLNILLIN